MKYIVNKEHFVHNSVAYKKGEPVELPESFDTMTSEALGLINRESKEYLGDFKDQRTGKLAESDPHKRFIQVQEDFQKNSKAILDKMSTDLKTAK